MNEMYIFYAIRKCSQLNVNTGNIRKPPTAQHLVGLTGLAFKMLSMLEPSSGVHKCQREKNVKEGKRKTILFVSVRGCGFDCV